MKNVLFCLAAVAAAVVLASGATAATLFDTTGGAAPNQANLSADSGQTFTTGVLGAENLIGTAVVEGPQGDNGENMTGALVLYLDGDQDENTWDPTGAVLDSTQVETLISGSATSGNGNGTGLGSLTTFTFANMAPLADNTVYALRWEDGAGTAVASMRVGLEGGQAYTGGDVFSGSGIPFGGAFDTAMQLDTKAIPEPATFALAGLSLMGLGGLRRRNK